MKICGHKGFSLPEIIGAIVVTTLLWVGMTMFYASMMEATRLPSTTASLIPPPVGVAFLNDGTGYSADDWDFYERAPSIGATQKAGILFADFLDMLDRADLVVVMGGSGAYPLNRDVASPYNSNHSAASRLDYNGSSLGPSIPGYFGNATTFSWGSVSPRKLSSSLEVHRMLPASAFQTAFDPGSFTVLFFRGAGDLIAVTECYRHEVNGKVYYSVQHYREPKNAATKQLTGTGLALHSYYRFYLDSVAEDAWAFPIGATHNWYRYDPSWQRVEEGPCTLVFPDPYVVLAQTSAGPTKPFSRFSYFLDPLN